MFSERLTANRSTEVAGDKSACGTQVLIGGMREVSSLVDSPWTGVRVAVE
jgi:hypothetical protein